MALLPSDVKTIRISDMRAARRIEKTNGRGNFSPPCARSAGARYFFQLSSPASILCMHKRATVHVCWWLQESGPRPWLGPDLINIPRTDRSPGGPRPSPRFLPFVSLACRDIQLSFTFPQKTPNTRYADNGAGRWLSERKESAQINLGMFLVLELKAKWRWNNKY